MTALLQTAWYRTRQDEYLRLTRFFGTLLVINVAIGLVTGLVQEFQFGMNWGACSWLVGNIFGAPLAMEGPGAFFLGASTRSQAITLAGELGFLEGLGAGSFSLHPGGETCPGHRCDSARRRSETLWARR